MVFRRSSSPNEIGEEFLTGREPVERKIGADVPYHPAVIVLIAAEILVAAINIVVDLYADAS
jgi:hypothetical protein